MILKVTDSGERTQMRDMEGTGFHFARIRHKDKSYLHYLRLDSKTTVNIVTFVCDTYGADAHRTHNKNKGLQIVNEGV